MTDSFLAPDDLEAARRRRDAIVRAQCRRFGVPEPFAEPAVVTLTSKPFGSQEERITVDTVCVVSDLVLWRWDGDSLSALAGRLGPDAVLAFLEPTAELGWRSALHRSGRRLFRAALGHDFATDVPVALRAAGLLVSTADRFGLGPAGIRSYVWGQAEHLSPIERG